MSLQFRQPTKGQPEPTRRRHCAGTAMVWLAILLTCLGSAGCTMFPEQGQGPQTVTEWMRQPRPPAGAGVVWP